jgi:hypothetical protein
MDVEDEAGKTRETHQIFDLTVKYLLKETSPANTVYLINALMDKQHPPDSRVSFRETENVAKRGSTLELFRSDVIASVNDEDYILEIQIGNDKTMGLRIFQYGFGHARRNVRISENGALLEAYMPEAAVVFLETAGTTPDHITFRLNSSGGRSLDYDIKVFKMPDHGIESLEEQRLLLLLPFCILRFRKELNEKSLTSEGRRILAEAAKQMILDLEAVLTRCLEKGLLSDRDCIIILESAARLYKELYLKHSEFKEGDDMLKKKIGFRLKALEKKFEKEKQEARNQVIALFKQGYTPEEVEELLARQEAAGRDDTEQSGF